MAVLQKCLTTTTVPCSEGYTVYLNSRLSEIQRLKAYKHELEHIDNGDYDSINTGLIEIYAHGKEQERNSYGF